MRYKNLLKVTMWIMILTLLTGVVRYSSVSIALQSSTIDLSLLETLEDPNYIVDIAWSYDAKFLASIDHTGIATVRSAINWNILTTFDCGPGYERLAWSPIQSTLAIGCYLDTPMSIEMVNDLTIVKFNSENQSPAWSANGTQIAVPQTDGTIAILNTSFQTTDTLGEPAIPDPMYGGEIVLFGAYRDFKWSPSGNYFASIVQGQAYGVTIWDLNAHQRVKDFVFAFDLIWASDGSTFTITVQDYDKKEGSLQTWNTSPLYMISSTLIPYDYSATTVEGAPNSQYHTHCEIGEPLELYDTTNLQSVTLIAPSPEMISCPIADIAWSSNSLLAIAKDQVISIWSVQIPDACTITANTPAELINAIQTANGTPEAATICLAQHGTYTFTSAHASLKALPAITSDLKIIGNGATLTRQAGSPPFRFFEVASNGILTLENLTLSGAEANADPGGAILNLGNLTVNNVTFSGNHAGTGAAIDNHRFGGTSNPITATISNSTFENNTANYGAALDNDANATMTVSGSTFTGNVAVHDGGVIDNDSSATFTDSTFTSNAAGRYGGAFETNGNLTLNGGTFSNNTAAQGGAVRNTSVLNATGTTFENNTSATGGGYEGWGGAIFNISTGNGTVTGAVFSQNSAVNGGAIRNHGVLSLTDSQILNNTASAGGSGIFSTGSTTAHNSCISGNTTSVTSVVHVGSNVQDFAGNYWGAANGPSGSGSGSGDSVNNKINFANFLASCPH